MALQSRRSASASNLNSSRRLRGPERGSTRSVSPTTAVPTLRERKSVGKTASLRSMQSSNITSFVDRDHGKNERSSGLVVLSLLLIVGLSGYLRLSGITWGMNSGYGHYLNFQPDEYISIRGMLPIKPLA